MSGVLLQLSLALLLIGTCIAGSHSGSGSGGGCESWKYSIRRDREADDSFTGSVLTKADLEDGLLRLPSDEIVRIAYYYSRFLEDDTGERIEELLDASIPLFSHSAAQWKYVNFEEVKSFVSIVEPSQTTIYWLWFLLKGCQLFETCNMLFAEIERIAKLLTTSAEDGRNRESLYSSLADMGVVSHQYIVLATSDGKYHSIEKFCDFIDIRSSFNKTAITHYQMGGHDGRSPRTNPRFAGRIGWRAPPKKFSLQDLVPFLKEEVNREYSLLFDNCKTFALRLWNKLTLDPLSIEGVMKEL